MFLYTFKKKTNNNRHCKKLLWDLFCKKKIKENYKKKNFFKFNENKLNAFIFKSYYYNKHNNKVYNIITDNSNNNIITVCKYGSEIGKINLNLKYSNYVENNENDLNRTLICFLKPGYFVNNVINNFNNIKIAFSEGTYCLIIKHYFDLNMTQVKLPSNNLKLISAFNDVYVGRNGNIYKKHIVWGSWGYKFKIKHHKPIVRGVAMNPVDHPNGGRTKVKKPFKNKYNKIAKKNK